MSWWDDILMQPESAGTLGAILGALNAPGLTLRDQAFNLLGGLGAAIYLAPWMAERADITSSHGRLAFAFLFGLIGMNLLAKLITTARQIDWSGILQMLTKGKQ